MGRGGIFGSVIGLAAGFTGVAALVGFLVLVVALVMVYPPALGWVLAALVGIGRWLRHDRARRRGSRELRNLRKSDDARLALREAQRAVQRPMLTALDD